MKNSINIRPVIRHDKQRKDGLYPLNLSIRVGGATNRVSTGKYIQASDWDSKSGCLKNNTKANQFINQILAAQMKSWWEKMYTLKTYRSTLNVLKKFAPKASFGDLTYAFIQKFDVYMSQKRGNSLNGRWGRHKCLRAVIREAIKKELIKESNYPYRHFEVKSTVSKREPLTVAEIQEIKTLLIPEKNGFLNRVRDIFLLSVYTGLRYSDIMRLSFEHVDAELNLIVIEMQKTKKVVTIPVLPDAKLILERYTKHKIKTVGLTIMPQMTNQVLNRELKILISKTNITKNVTFHIARYAFASSLVQADINPFIMMELMGHARITQTQTYIKPAKTNLVKSMEKLADTYSKAVNHGKQKIENHQATLLHI
ncbi:hypothetical protein EWM62_08625 [Mucilaginibacter terrigena]|uniref:Site-specific integrase n=1 Tax=Mucilaginibacter terrigena TaxID=2492395 RepID=A0A4Q5LLR9_9SPHI|nr:site-specific integrase [Mucilaginibacter terrigena]RYU90701.1 hypothetical protein EWM62_08625 [Mucilaginibacter terrigena]